MRTWGLISNIPIVPCNEPPRPLLYGQCFRACWPSKLEKPRGTGFPSALKMPLSCRQVCIMCDDCMYKPAIDQRDESHQNTKKTQLTHGGRIEREDSKK